MDGRERQVKTSLKGEDWLQAAALQKLFGVLEAHGQARVAGGAVRDALLGRPVADVDVATTIPPEEVIRILTAAGIKAVPTGLEHGTVTAVAGPRESDVFQVTTLRLDVETDGRRAKVAFTGDWAADAGRRDLTMNALYCDRHGALFDPLGGYEDLKSGRVRFVGDAARRIEEDYLRILRFFRFNAVFGHTEFDADGLAACIGHREGIDRLSGERLHQEMFKLLPAPGAVATLGVMADSGILEHVIPAHRDIDRFARLCAIEAQCGRAPDTLLRLAALALGDSDDVARLREHLVLTNVQSARLTAVMADRVVLDAKLADPKLHEVLYRWGVPAYLDAALFDWAASKAGPDSREWAHIVQMPGEWQPPVFPLKGADVVAGGMERGPLVGEILHAVETWWIDAGFPDDETVVRDRLGSVLRKHLNA